MFKSIQLLFLFIMFLASCKITEKKIVGKYSYEYAAKTMIQINADRTFDFFKSNKNPYLHPSDHPDEYFFRTKGSWQLGKHSSIVLTSIKDSLIYPLVTIEKQAANDSSRSKFTFYDQWHDTVKILYVQYSDTSIAMAMHRSMDFFSEDLRARDTFEFHFYGYPSHTFVNNGKQNFDFAIKFQMAFRPAFFNNTALSVKHKKLIQVTGKNKYIFLKTPH